MTKYFTKDIKVLDAKTSIWEVIQHSFVNFLYGFLSGLVITATMLGSPYLILASYYILKQVESRVLNRNKYSTKLGKYWIFPIPSTIGFLLGWYSTTLIA